MRLTEHQARKLLAARGIAFPDAMLADSPEAAELAAVRFGGPVMVKAQVPCGSRGKAGGVLRADTSSDARAAAARLLSTPLRGITVHEVSIEPCVEFVRELYLGATWDTSARQPLAIFSSAGGVDVERTAGGDLYKRLFDPTAGLSPFEGREMVRTVGLTGKLLVETGALLHRVTIALLELDALTVEINPLVETNDHRVLALDARVEIDDDALYRQMDRLKPLGPIAATAAGRAQTALELAAERIDSMDHRGVAGRLVEFDGDLGLLIGGGGASLLVFDAIRAAGGKPANYCEVGGNPTEEKVAALTTLLLSKPGVRKLAVIMNVVNNTRADVMARGVLAGIRQAGRQPRDTLVVFRIPGSWEQQCQALLAEAGVEALGREHSLEACARFAVERMAQPC